MNKTLMTAVFGATFVFAWASFGQGYVVFSNNGVTTGAPVYYDFLFDDPPEKGGLEVGNAFKAGFRYEFGGGPLTTAGATAVFAGAEGEVSGGLFNGGTVAIPGYTSGPISFVVFAYNGADYDHSTIRGDSTQFTLDSISTASESPTEFGPGFASFTVMSAVPIPEPSAFALAGLGVAGLLAFRRRAH